MNSTAIKIITGQCIVFATTRLRFQRTGWGRKGDNTRDTYTTFGVSFYPFGFIEYSALNSSQQGGIGWLKPDKKKKYLQQVCGMLWAKDGAER